MSMIGLLAPLESKWCGSQILKLGNSYSLLFFSIFQVFRKDFKGFQALFLFKRDSFVKTYLDYLELSFVAQLFSLTIAPGETHSRE